MKQKFSPIIINIKLKSKLNHNTLRFNLNNIFRRAQFKNVQFVSIRLKVTMFRSIKSLGNKYILDLNNTKDIKKYIDHVLNVFDSKFVNAYNVDDVSSLIFTVIDCNQNDYSSFSRRMKYSEFNPIAVSSYFNLPFNTNYHTWGNYIILGKGKFLVKDIAFNSNIESIYLSYGNKKATLDFNIINEQSKLRILDVIGKDGNIQREIYMNDKQIKTYIFDSKSESSMLYLDHNVLPAEFKKDRKGNPTNERLNIITPLHLSDKIVKFKGITLDIETYIHNNEHKLLCICFYNGVKTFTFYRSDYESDNSMLKQCFNKLFVRQNHNHNIYIHNGSSFDLVFILEYLLNRDGIKLIPMYDYNSNTLKAITIKYRSKNKEGNDDIFTITIQDSMLLLINSLSKLGKAFNVECQKDIFPYFFPNSENLNYIGEVPNYKYFNTNKVNTTEYSQYKDRFLNKDWNMKNVTLDYCSKDCISLYQIINHFKFLINEEFGVDIQTCPTISSLAFKIFKTNFLNSKEIPLLTRNIFDELKPSFFGGHCDAYIPSGPSGNGSYSEIMSKYNSLDDKSLDNIKNVFKTIKHYDVNSLYPSVMKDRKYPTDIICRFIGNIVNTDLKALYDNKLGIYTVKVKAPNIKHPLLPIKSNGITSYGYGNWTGTYFSEEIKNAEKYGYKFEILSGYIFESESLFEDYVDTLNTIKQTSAKDEPMYLISKILMNSLFGRFGLNPWLGESEFLTKSQFQELIDSKTINEDSYEDCVEFKNHYLVTWRNNKNFSSQACLPISIAVASYARIFMSAIFNRDDITLYYTDTDSVLIEEYLGEEIVDSKALGQWKLENEYIYGIFLGPKEYGALNIKGESYSKVKGYKKEVPLNILSRLLNQHETELLFHEKWFRDFKASSIEIDPKSKYQLKSSGNKRILIYKDTVLVSTENKFIDESNH